MSSGETHWIFWVALMKNLNLSEAFLELRKFFEISCVRTQIGLSIKMQKWDRILSNSSFFSEIIFPDSDFNLQELVPFMLIVRSTIIVLPYRSYLQLSSVDFPSIKLAIFNVIWARDSPFLMNSERPEPRFVQLARPPRPSTIPISIADFPPVKQNVDLFLIQVKNKQILTSILSDNEIDSRSKLQMEMFMTHEIFQKYLTYMSNITVVDVILIRIDSTICGHRTFIKRCH